MRFFLLILSLAFGAPAIASVAETLAKLQGELLRQRSAEGVWDGGLEADASSDAFMLLFDQKLKLFSDPQVKIKLLERIYKARAPGKFAWSAVPGGPADISVTGTVLLALKKLGVASTKESGVAWKWFEAQGGLKAIHPCHALLLMALDVLPRNTVPFLTPKFLALPMISPINIYNMGVYRTVLVPILVWDYYRQVESGTAKRLDPARRKSNGGQFAQGCGFTRDQMGPANPDADLEEVMRAADANINFSFCSSDYWAQEGLGWLLGHQQRDGNWYVLQSTLLSVLAIQEAQRAGVGNFSEVLQRALAGVRGFQKTATDGTIYFQVSSSSVWDTARSLTALGPGQADRSAVEFLLRTQALEKGDWSVLAPRVPAGGWAFAASQEDNYPDVDTAAAVSEALLVESESLKDPRIHTAVSKAIRWIMGMQNSDGGFPAWDKNASANFSRAVSFFWRKKIELSDISQSDITARLLKILTRLRAKKEFRALISAADLKRACGYLEAHGENIWRGDWWVNYLYATAEVSEALLESGCRSLAQSRKALTWLAHAQNKDGGWGESIASYPAEKFVPGPSSVSQSTFILRALIHYEKLRAPKDLSYREAIEAGVHYLMAQAERDPSLTSPDFSGVYVKNALYVSYQLLPLYETVHVLRDYQELN